MAFWAAVRLQPQRDRLALHWPGLYGFETYAPRLRERRISRGRKVIKTRCCFPVTRSSWSSCNGAKLGSRRGSPVS
jgi:hypothetical protein